MALGSPVTTSTVPSSCKAVNTLANSLVLADAKSNASITKAARLFADGNVRVVDWDAFATHHHGLLWGDGIHPKGEGTTAYAKLIRTAIRQ